MAMLGPVVASADFVGVLLGAATAGVEDGLAGVAVAVTVLVVAVVAGADGVDGFLRRVDHRQQVGVGLAVIAGAIFMGGVKRIAAVTETHSS